jgi:hypothetical protein
MENLIYLYADGAIPVYDPVFMLDMRAGSLNMCFTQEAPSASEAVRIGTQHFLKALELLGLDVQTLDFASAGIQPPEPEEVYEEEDEGED